MFYHLGEEKTRRRERPRALFARRAPTMKQWSLDARSRGQPWPLPIKEKRKRGRRISIFTPVLAQRGHLKDEKGKPDRPPARGTRTIGRIGKAPTLVLCSRNARPEKEHERAD